MKIILNSKLDESQNVLVFGVFEEDSHYKSFPKEFAKEIQERKIFKREAGETYSSRISGKRVLAVGLGKEGELTIEKVRKVLGKSVKHAKSLRLTSFSTNIPALVGSKMNEELLGRATAEALLLANYDFTKYFDKEKQEKKKPLEKVSLQWDKSQNLFEKGVKAGEIIGNSSNFVRDLVNEPANVTNSIYMEKMAREVAKNPKVKITVMNELELKKEGMDSLLGVNAGSNNPPKLIFVEYHGGGNGKWHAVVGKGITFDSGGYNIKPTRYIEDMKIDMAGSAACLGTLKAVSELGIQKNIVAVLGLCENMVSSKAQRPGDIVKAYNGKTIEIGNTDAEGRLVLADALAYTEKKYKPEIMVDFATLTGACVVALGYYSAAVMGKHDDLIDELKQAGLTSGDKVWPLPFFEDFQNWMDGSISDLNNISQKGKGYEAGSITAGVFLSKFVKDTKWAHVDIAGSAYWEIEGEYLKKGATGSGVRLMSYYFMDN